MTHGGRRPWLGELGPSRLLNGAEALNATAWGKALYVDGSIQQMNSDVARRIKGFQSQINGSRQAWIRRPYVTAIVANTGGDCDRPLFASQTVEIFGSLAIYCVGRTIIDFAVADDWRR